MQALDCRLAIPSACIRARTLDYWQLLCSEGQLHPDQLKPSLVINLPARSITSWELAIGKIFSAFKNFQANMDHEIGVAIGANETDLRVFQEYWKGLESPQSVSLDLGRFSEEFCNVLGDMASVAYSAIQSKLPVMQAVEGIEKPLATSRVNQARWNLTYPVLVKAVRVATGVLGVASFSKGERALIARDENFLGFRHTFCNALGIHPTWFPPLDRDLSMAEAICLEGHDHEENWIRLAKKRFARDSRALGLILETPCETEPQWIMSPIEVVVAKMHLTYRLCQSMIQGQVLPFEPCRAPVTSDLWVRALDENWTDANSYCDRKEWAGLSCYSDFRARRDCLYIDYTMTALDHLIERFLQCRSGNEDLYQAIEEAQLDLKDCPKNFRDFVSNSWNTFLKSLKVVFGKEAVSFNWKERECVHRLPHFSIFRERYSADLSLPPPESIGEKIGSASGTTMVYESQIKPYLELLRQNADDIRKGGDVTIPPSENWNIADEMEVVPHLQWYRENLSRIGLAHIAEGESNDSPKHGILDSLLDAVRSLV